MRRAPWTTPIMMLLLLPLLFVHHIALDRSGALAQASTPGSCNDDSFIRAEGRFFIQNCERFFYRGYNAYYIAHDSSQTVGVLQLAQSLDLNVVRVHSFSDGLSGPNYLQPYPGVYNEDAFKKFDFMLYQAHLHGQYVVMPLVNYWKAFGGMEVYVQWSPTAFERDDFYTDANCKAMFKSHLSAMVNRVNTYTNKRYGDDPTIFAWQLTNEGRSLSGNAKFNNWLNEMSTYLKSIDPNHMVGTGTEGFFGDGSPYSEQFSPGTWSEGAGTNFVGDNLLPNIDFATLHLFPDSWAPYTWTCAVPPGCGQWSESKKLEFSSDWFNIHIKIAMEMLQKPLILMEFNKWPYWGMQYREQMFQQVFADALAAEKGEWPCQKSSSKVQLSSSYGSCGGNSKGTGQYGAMSVGTAFWELVPSWLCGFENCGQYGVVPGFQDHETTLAIIAANGQNLQAVSGEIGSSPSPPPPSPSPPPPPPPSSSTPTAPVPLLSPPPPPPESGPPPIPVYIGGGFGELFKDALFDWSWQAQVNFFQGYVGVQLSSNGILSVRADPPIEQQGSSSAWLRFYIRVPSVTGYENAAAALLKLSLQTLLVVSDPPAVAIESVGEYILQTGNTGVSIESEDIAMDEWLLVRAKIQTPLGFIWWRSTDEQAVEFDLKDVQITFDQESMTSPPSGTPVSDMPQVIQDCLANDETCALLSSDGVEDFDTIPVIDGSVSGVFLVEIDTVEYLAFIGTNGCDCIWNDNSVYPSIIYGNEGADVILGSDKPDIIYAGDGRDVVYGGGGNDAIYGEKGKDILYGEAGRDVIIGGSKKDTLFGGKGRDTLIGSGGSDYLLGGASKDSLDGGKGPDSLKGGGASDIIRVCENDVMEGSSDKDTIKQC